MLKLFITIDEDDDADVDISEPDEPIPKVNCCNIVDSVELQSTKVAGKFDSFLVVKSND